MSLGLVTEQAITDYMSRVVDLPPLVARAAFELGTPYRAIRGTLHAGLRSMAVDLELMTWSGLCVQLGLHPRLGRRRLHPCDLLFADGHEMLARLDRILCPWAEAPLLDVRQERRSLGEDERIR